MKKLLIFIFSIFFGLIGFSSAELFSFNQISRDSLTYNTNSDNYFILSTDTGVNFSVTGFYLYGCYNFSPSDYVDFVLSGFNNNNFTFSSFVFNNNYSGYLVSFDSIVINSQNPLIIPYRFYDGCNLVNAPRFYRDYFLFSVDFQYNGSFRNQFPIYGVFISLVDSSSSSTIKVNYNNGSFTTVSCDGDSEITINGLSTMSSTSTFIPYFNINYTDQNNQVLTDSYSNDILYLSGGQYLKTYTGGSNNDWILNLVTSEDTVFTGYLPTFDVTGNITEIDTGNVFNNFAENSLTVLLSNIPNYIQYVIMFALLLFVLGIFRKLRK